MISLSPLIGRNASSRRENGRHVSSARSTTPFKHAGVSQELCERATSRLIAAHAEQRFGGDVEIENCVSVVDDEHAGAETIQNARGVDRQAVEFIAVRTAMCIRHPAPESERRKGA